MSGARAGVPGEGRWHRVEAVIGVVSVLTGAIFGVLQWQESRSAAAPVATAAPVVSTAPDTPDTSASAGADAADPAKKGRPMDGRNCLIGTWQLSRWAHTLNASQFVLDTPGTVDMKASDTSTFVIQFNEDGSGSDVDNVTFTGYGSTDGNFYSITEVGRATFRFSVSGTTVKYSMVSGSDVVDASVNHTSLGRQTIPAVDETDIFTCSAGRLTLAGIGYKQEFIRA